MVLPKLFIKKYWICAFCFIVRGFKKTQPRLDLKILKHLNQKIKKHEMSARHMNCSAELTLLGHCK